jgi:hypothetical protein
MTNSIRIGIAALGLVALCNSMAADFDGSKLLICAPVVALDCTAGAPCQGGTPEEIGAPPFLRIDFGKKLVIGKQRSAPIALVEKSESQVLIQGTELGYGWAIAIDQQGGRMSASLTDREGVFILFGECTPD